MLTCKFLQSEARGTNDAGQVVGGSFTTEGLFHAFTISSNGIGMMDLNSLVDLPEGVFLIRAIDINNNGQVIATGIVPEPETYALMLAGFRLGWVYGTAQEIRKPGFGINLSFSAWPAASLAFIPGERMIPVHGNGLVKKDRGAN